MASKHSYKITLSNNKTEKQAINYLLSVDKRFLMPTKEGRKKIVEILELDRKYSRTFDLFMLPGFSNDQKEISIRDRDNITLVELKTTKKFLPNNPKDFFFGATKNEFDVAKMMKHKYLFCFVSLHPDSLGYKLLTLNELSSLIKNKRTQYQINLKK